jgi:hypothetical protein
MEKNQKQHRNGQKSIVDIATPVWMPEMFERIKASPKINNH